MHFINTSDLVDPDWTFLQAYCPDPSISWEFHIGRPRNVIERLIRRPDIARWRAAGQAARSAAKSAPNSVLVSHLPRMTAATNTFRRRFCPEVPHIAFAFNFTDLPTGIDRTRLRSSISDIDEFVVFSTYERTLYSDYFDIPIERFVYLPWAMEPPVPGTNRVVRGKERYLCSIGGEGRDYALLAAAMRELPDLAMVIVARPASIEGIDFPDNVAVHTNLPGPDTWRIAQDSAGIVIPLKTEKTACGHITIVGAHMLGLPMIVTRSCGVEDYIQDDENALVVSAGNLDAMGAALRKLWEDQGLAARLGRTARDVSRQRNSLDTWVAYFQEKHAIYRERIN